MKSHPFQPEDAPIAGKNWQDAKTKFFLSWGGEIYGPATSEEISTGLRTAWFEEGTLFWHEGLDEWQPLTQFSPSTDFKPGETLKRIRAGDLPRAPSLPPKDKDSSHARRRRSPGASRQRGRKLGLGSRAIVFGFAFLAVLLTVGILLLLMLI